MKQNEQNLIKKEEKYRQFYRDHFKMEKQR